LWFIWMCCLHIQLTEAQIGYETYDGKSGCVICNDYGTREIPFS